jgi:hypothetical protein
MIGRQREHFTFAIENPLPRATVADATTAVLGERLVSDGL